MKFITKNTVLTIAACSIFIVGFLALANHRDAALRAIDRCANDRAALEGMRGTPAQKWDLFAKDCADAQ